MIAPHLLSAVSAVGADALLSKAGRPLCGLCLNLSRRFATRKEADAGPKEQDLSVIPFQATREAASQSFKEYHRGHLLFTRPSAGLQKIKEAFLPFWVTTATADVQLHGAQLGTDTWVQRYNPQTRRYEPRLETVWQWVELQRASWEQHYAPTEEGMQVYAAYKYPRQEVNQIRPGVSMAAARPLQPEMMVSAFDGSTRRVGEFEMKPSVAQRFVRDFIRGQEESRARQLVRNSFRCDRVGQLRMSIDLQGVAASPVYLPVFVFRSTHFGTKLRTFVSGVRPEQVTGSRALDEARVGLVGAVLGGIVGMASGAFTGMSPWSIWVWGIALPATVAAFAARNYTQLRNRWNAFRQASERASQEAENEQAAWDPDWVRQYARLFAGRMRSSSSRDPKGYYATMGVEPDASRDEIQAAYRGLALKYHPDRVPEAEKQEALRRFQAVQEAYSVLRATEKRRLYDRGGSMR